MTTPRRFALPFFALLAGGCASSAALDPLVGTWEMLSHMEGSAVPATMTLERDSTGVLSGDWNSRGTSMELTSIQVDGERIEFDREIPGGRVLHFVGGLSGEALIGTWSGPFGEIPVEGSRLDGEPEAQDVAGYFHDRPIIEEDGRTLLWANDEEWFDVTDSKIDPTTFQYGIGKDTIPSIDAPVFADFDDPRLEEAGITPDTPVLGVVLEGEARAYPVDLMDGHEIVNDRFADKAYAVLW